MKLGIVVVYLVDGRNEKLLDLHLNRIEKETDVPFTIYASANRLQPEFRKKLDLHPRVKVCDIPTTPLRGAAEHSFYLDRLVRNAVAEEVTHVVVLHVDSFPVRSGWAVQLAEKLSGSCVLSAIMPDADHYHMPSTACLMFGRDFFLKYQPTFLLSETELASAAYKKYSQEFKHPSTDSGVGYGFKVYAEGLSWYPLRRSRGEADYSYGGIYDELIFHLGGAAWVLKGNAVDKKNIFRQPRFVSFLSRVREAIRPLVPGSLKKYLALPVNRLIMKPMLERIRTQLLEDPESYLNSLQK